MSKIQFLILLVFALFTSASALSQNAYIKLYIDPSDNYRVKLNGGEEQRTNSFSVFPGENRVSIWAPGYLILDTILDLQLEEKRVFTAFLEKSDEYEDWLEVRRQLNDKAIKMQVPPALMMLSAAIYTVVQQVQFVEASNRVENAVELYESSYTPGIFDEIREEYDAAQDDYRKQRTQLIVGYSLTAATTAFLIYQVKRAAKIKIPEFIDPYKLEFEGLTYTPRLNQLPSSLQGSLSLKF